MQRGNAGTKGYGALKGNTVGGGYISRPLLSVMQVPLVTKEGEVIDQRDMYRGIGYSPSRCERHREQPSRAGAVGMQRLMG